MDTITRQRLSDQVRDRLIEAIGNGEYPAGSQLPSERELMLRLGVGRPAVREAMQALQNMGLIRIAHGERARVVLPSPETIIDQMSGAMIQLLSASPRGLSDLKESRILLETGLVQMATRRATAASLKVLRDTMGACGAARGDTARFVAADMDFHVQIASMSGNTLITAVSRGMLEWLMRFKRDMVSVKGAERLTMDEHERIYKAIAAGDQAEAAQAMRDHLERANELYHAIQSNQ